MEAVPLTILGAGDLRCTLGVIGSLGTYYGERPLELRLFDSDEERLDLFDLLARRVFEDTSVEHAVKASSEPAELLEGAKLVVLQLDGNCARKYLARRQDDTPASEAKTLQLVVDGLLRSIPEDAELLVLLPEAIDLGERPHCRLDWPPALDDDSARALKFQVLRWLNREEGIYALVDAHERSPFKRWLDDPAGFREAES